jgi:hypothetical protein
VNAEPDDDPVQGDRNDDRLEHQRDGGGDIEMRRVLHECLPGDRGGKHKGVRSVDVEQRVETVLIELEETDQHQCAGKQMGDVKVDPAHQKLPDTKRSNVASNPSIKAAFFSRCADCCSKGSHAAR